MILVVGTVFSAAGCAGVSQCHQVEVACLHGPAKGTGCLQHSSHSFWQDRQGGASKGAILRGPRSRHR
eukprot:3694207-Amphidinium_carterae.1